jgi:hypothetical protein
VIKPRTFDVGAVFVCVSAVLFATEHASPRLPRRLGVLPVGEPYLRDGRLAEEAAMRGFGTFL